MNSMIDHYKQYLLLLIVLTILRQFLTLALARPFDGRRVRGLRIWWWSSRPNRVGRGRGWGIRRPRRWICRRTTRSKRRPRRRIPWTSWRHGTVSRVGICRVIIWIRWWNSCWRRANCYCMSSRVRCIKKTNLLREGAFFPKCNWILISLWILLHQKALFTDLHTSSRPWDGSSVHECANTNSEEDEKKDDPENPRNCKFFGFRTI